MRNLLGNVTGKLTSKCNRDNISQKIEHRIVTRDVGPFSLTGLDLFLDVMEKVFAEFKQVNPGAYADLFNGGCLCVRLVRGSKESPSNHSWGTAWDGGFGGMVDSRGDGFCFKGMLDLYAIAKKHKLFWGATFGTEDAMHFEASEELIREWVKAGLI